MQHSDNDILVETHGLKHAYREAGQDKQVLHGIDLQIRAGTTNFLTGFSGSGKTTLISLVGCLRSVQEGSLKLLGEELKGASEAKLRQMRCRIGYVFQHFNLLDFMTIRQNVMQSLELQPAFSRQEAIRRADEMLDRVGLGDRVKSYPKELSGGQKQRVAIARALVHKPKLVLADEPTAALDTSTGREVIEIFQQLAQEQNSATLIVTHNIRVLDAADDIFHMIDGRLGTAVGEQLSLVFPTLDDRQLRHISDQTERRAYSPGEVIIHQGQEADAFYLLLKGQVDIVRETQNAAPEVLSQLNQRGNYFGEMGLLQENAKRTATVRATGDSDVEVLVIGRSTFADMVGDSRQTQAVIKDEMYRRLTGQVD